MFNKMKKITRIEVFKQLLYTHILKTSISSNLLQLHLHCIEQINIMKDKDINYIYKIHLYILVNFKFLQNFSNRFHIIIISKANSGILDKQAETTIFTM